MAANIYHLGSSVVRRRKKEKKRKGTQRKSRIVWLNMFHSKRRRL